MATKLLTLGFAVLLTADATAQGWPFSDAPEPVGFGILQTANQASVGSPDPTAPGVIMSADALDLGPGEVVIGGDPILQETGIVVPQGNAKGGIPYRPLHHSGRGPQRRPRGATRFGPAQSQECAWGCPEGCAPAIYGNFEALYIDRGDDAFNYSRNLFGFSEDDYQLGVRVTLGRMCNCSDGYEATFTGMLEWERNGFRNDPTGQLNFGPMEVAPFFPGYVPAVPAMPAIPGVPDPVLGGFLVPPVAATPAVPAMSGLAGLYNTSFQSQRFRAKYNSFELNHREWGWDVISTVAGVRMINYQERFNFASDDRDAGGLINNTGRFNQSIDNVMIGAQLGLDLMYPVMRRMMIGSRVRGGVYANLVESDTELVNNNVTLIRNTFDDTDYAGLIESGVSVNYHFLPFFSAKLGYEFWYMMHVSTIAAEQTATIFPGYGATGATDDIGFHGLTASMEILF